jgi:cysteine desulfurase
MERAGEIELAVIPVDRECLVNLGALEAALDRRTMLVSVMYVNNEVGTIQPIAKVADLIRRVRSSVGGYPLFHTDAAQAFLYYRCGVEELGVDLMTLSSQKIHGPKGAGALVVREGALEPEVTGGGQEFGLRAGTENVPAIIGFAAAVSITERERARNIVRVAKLRDTFERELLRRVPGTVRNGPRRALLRAPHITNIAFSNVSSEDLLVRFDRVGVAASPGAACSSRALARRSHVLRAMGIPDRRIERSIRFSMGKDLARLDVVRAAERVARAALLFPETPVILRKSRKKRRNIT